MPKLTFCGHSCALIETDQGAVVIDPFLTGNPLASHGVDEIPPLKAVLLSHGHADHLGDAVALAKKNGAPVAATYELAVYCQTQGTEAIPMNIGGTADLGCGSLKLVQAWHSSSFQVGDDFVYTGMPTGVIFKSGGKTLYHLGDTGLFSDLELIGRMNGPIDVALVPIGDHFTMGIDEAVEACVMIQPKLAVPVHYNTFPPIERDPNEFAAKLEAAGLQAKILEPGGTLDF